eukprot:5373877-Amphidinium_carterae.1
MEHHRPHEVSVKRASQSDTDLLVPACILMVHAWRCALKGITNGHHWHCHHRVTALLAPACILVLGARRLAQNGP